MGQLPREQGHFKLHALLDLRCSIQTFIHSSDGNRHAVNTLDIIPYETGSFYVIDRGYLNISRLYALSQSLAFFLIRAKFDLQCRRIYSHPVDRSTSLISNQTIIITGFDQRKDYPEKLRRIKYHDTETNFPFCLSGQQIQAIDFINYL